MTSITVFVKWLRPQNAIDFRSRPPFFRGSTMEGKMVK